MSKESRRISGVSKIVQLLGRRQSNKSKAYLSDVIDPTMSEIPTKQVRIYQPTYQLNPRKRFDVEKIEKMLNSTLEMELAEVEYSEKAIPELCMSLSENIRNSVKEENYDRYRIIVSISIGQRRQQSVHVFHSFLWDPERDSFASATYENCHIFAYVTVYAVYLD